MQSTCLRATGTCLPIPINHTVWNLTRHNQLDPIPLSINSHFEKNIDTESRSESVYGPRIKSSDS